MAALACNAGSQGMANPSPVVAVKEREDQPDVGTFDPYFAVFFPTKR
jgi:hypothetical protein